MRIRLLTAMAGHNWSASSDELIQVSPEEGRRLIASGQAAPVETATIGPAENAALVTRPAEPRRRREKTK